VNQKLLFIPTGRTDVWELREGSSLIPTIFLRDDAVRTRETMETEEAALTVEAAWTEEAAWIEEAAQTEEAEWPSYKDK
jgi:hypothetical protein